MTWSTAALFESFEKKIKTPKTPKPHQVQSWFWLLNNCKNRTIREDVYRKFGSKCNGGKFDNSENLKMISKLRDEKAKLLGYDTHADYVLDRRMAKSKDNVYKLINDLIVPSHKTALEEYNKLANFAKKVDDVKEVCTINNHTIYMIQQTSLIPFDVKIFFF